MDEEEHQADDTAHTDLWQQTLQVRSMSKSFQK